MAYGEWKEELVLQAEFWQKISLKSIVSFLVNFFKQFMMIKGSKIMCPLLGS